jgi:hypothetical protein
MGSWIRLQYDCSIGLAALGLFNSAAKNRPNVDRGAASGGRCPFSLLRWAFTMQSRQTNHIVYPHTLIFRDGKSEALFKGSAPAAD